MAAEREPRPSRRRRYGRLLLATGAVLSIGLGLLLLTLHLPPVQQRLAVRLLDATARKIDCTIELDGVTVNLVTGRARLWGMRLTAPRAGPPVSRLHVDSVSAELVVLPLLGGSINVHALEINGVSLVLRRGEDGNLVLPAFGDEPAAGVSEGAAEPSRAAVRLGSVIITGLTMEVELDTAGRRVGLSGARMQGSLDLAELSGAGLLLAPETWVEGPRGRLQEALEVRWRLDGGKGSADVRLEGPLLVNGTVSIAGLPNQPKLSSTGTIALPLAPFGEVLAPDLGLAGSLRCDVTTSSAGAVDLTLEGHDIIIRGWHSDTIHASATYLNGHLQVRSFEASLAGGRVRGNGGARLVPELSDLELDATLDGLQLEELLAPLNRNVRVAGVLGGRLEARAERPEFTAFSGTVELVVAQGGPSSNATIRPVGRLNAALTDGVVELRQADIVDRDAEIHASGRYDLVAHSWSGRALATVPDVAAYLALLDLEGSGQVALDLVAEAGPDGLMAEGFAAVAGVTVAGLTVDRASFELGLRDRRLAVLARGLVMMEATSEMTHGEVSLPPGKSSSLTVTGQGLSYRGVPWPDLHAHGELGPAMWVEAASADGQLWLRLQGDPRSGALLDVRLDGFPLELVAPLAPPPARDLTGLVSATAKVSLDPQWRVTAAELFLAQLCADQGGYQVVVSHPSRVQLAGGWLLLDLLELNLGQAGKLAASGSLDLGAGTMDLALVANNVDLARWSDLAGVPLAGHCDVDILMQGSTRAPRPTGSVLVEGLQVAGLTVAGARGRFVSQAAGELAGDLSLEGVSWQGDQLGNAHFEVRTEGSGVRVDGSLRDGQALLQATCGLEPPWQVSADAVLTHMEIGSIASTLGLPIEVGGTVTGVVRMSGPIADLSAAEHFLDLKEVDITIAAAPLRGAVSLRLERGILDVQRAELANDAVRLHAQGSLAISGAGPTTPASGIAFATEGDLDSLLAVLPWLDRAAGVLKGELRVDGTLTAPLLSGWLTLANGTVDGPELPSPLDRLAARLSIFNGTLRLESLSARFAGGTVEATATVALTGARAGELSGTVRARDLDASLSDRLTVQAALDLTVGGTVSRPLLSGELRIDRATYIPRVDLLGVLARLAADAVSLRPVPLGAAPADDATIPPVDLDILVHAPATIEVLGSMINADLSARLQLAGSTRSPQITGGITVERGEAKLFGSSFEVAQGAVDFLDPASLDPEVRISAVTTKSGDEITVSITGWASKPYLQLSSSRGRSQEEILRLLLGGAGASNDAHASDALVGAAARSAITALAQQLGTATDVTIVPFPVTAEGDALLFLISDDLGGGVVVSYGMASESGNSDVVEVLAELGPRSFVRLRQNTDGSVSGGIRLRGKIQ